MSVLVLIIFTIFCIWKIVANIFDFFLKMESFNFFLKKQNCRSFQCFVFEIKNLGLFMGRWVSFFNEFAN
jgi:hypothetical protein